MFNDNHIELTESEKSIEQYIIEHPQEVLAMSVRDLADATFTGAATVVRLYRKLGYDGFNEFKIALAMEADGQSILKNIDADNPEMSSSDISQIIAIISDLKRRAIRRTETTLKKTRWSEVLSLINKAHGITVYGAGFSAAPLSMFEQNMRRIGYNTSIITDDSTLANWICTCKKEELLILISYSGLVVENKARILQKRGIPFILVTSESEKMVSKLATQVIKIAGLETKDEFGRISHISSVTASEYALDVLYSMIFAQHYDENIRKLDETLKLQSMDQFFKSNR